MQCLQMPRVRLQMRSNLAAHHRLGPQTCQTSHKLRFLSWAANQQSHHFPQIQYRTKASLSLYPLLGLLSQLQLPTAATLQATHQMPSVLSRKQSDPVRTKPIQQTAPRRLLLTRAHSQRWMLKVRMALLKDVLGRRPTSHHPDLLRHNLECHLQP